MFTRLFPFSLSIQITWNWKVFRLFYSIFTGDQQYKVICCIDICVCPDDPQEMLLKNSWAEGCEEKSRKICVFVWGLYDCWNRAPPVTGCPIVRSLLQKKKKQRKRVHLYIVTPSGRDYSSASNNRSWLKIDKFYQSLYLDFGNSTNIIENYNFHCYSLHRKSLCRETLDNNNYIPIVYLHWF